MRVNHIPCGDFANESERQAFETIKQKLIAQAGSDEWIILSNVSHSFSSQHQSDEIDFLVVGPQGLFVIEVKHWDRTWIKKNQIQVETEAEKLSNKVRRVATSARRRFSALPRVPGRVLLTAESKAFGSTTRLSHRGIEFFTLKEIKELLDLDEPAQLPSAVVKDLCHYLEPRTKLNLTGGMRRLGDFTNLELQSPTSERFHRVYRGTHTRTQDKIILHLYDLSALDDNGAENLAAREFETMQRLQKSPWVPRFRDSLQDVQGFIGEMKFFTMVDPCAPALEERAGDPTWTTSDRVEFIQLAVKALDELHASTSDDAQPIVHRNLCPSIILVTARNRVLFTGFSLARIPGLDTVGKAALPIGESAAFVAPEVQKDGLASGDQRSDVYSLAASLLTILYGRQEKDAGQCRTILQTALVENPADRVTLTQLAEQLGALVEQGHQQVHSTQSESVQPLPRYWSEDVTVSFNNKFFRIVSRLGSGGLGLTFKVVEVDPATGENFGTYVGKTINEEAPGNAALKAYQRVRAHTAYPNLSVIYETASTWHNNSFVALLKWVEGDSLDSLYGVLPLVAEESGDASVEALVLRWCKDLCEALSRLHCAGLIHGDVSPRNIIVYHGEVTLTDYDLVTPNGTKASGCGALMFCSREAELRQPLSYSDDVFALAASLFRALTDREPFLPQGSSFDKSKGVQWLDDQKTEMPLLTEFVSRATSPIRDQRITSAMAALEWLESKLNPASANKPTASAVTVAPASLTANEVPWLKFILQVYPGSAYGNVETRGLDSPFAIDTYVETALEEALFDDILARRVRLVILCGNAGDGKTALLQHLARRFGVPELTSAQRVWEATTTDGLRLKANLDGAAAFRGKSANELLDEFFAPFMQGNPAEDVAHLLAINDGRLLEWIDSCQIQGRVTPLVDQLTWLLDQESDVTLPDSHIRLIDLNSRSLVGSLPLDPETKKPTTEFLDKLIDKLLGGEHATELWKACRTCIALTRCQAGSNVKLLMDHDPKSRGKRIRERLAEALQAVHQRAEVHITARELRATLSYILFGIHYCTDLHESPQLQPAGYWDLAFDPDSPLRQGEVLREFTFLDPGLETHPMIDRHLSGQVSREFSNGGTAYPELSLASARRRAYFEWHTEEIHAVGMSPDALGLAHGHHLSLFKDAGLRNGEADLCAKLCRGISRLEELPRLALDRSEKGQIPLKVSPRTPTETIFWVEKPLESFRLEPELGARDSSLPLLHRRLRLTYTYQDGCKEVLSMAYELFHTLLELESGFQLDDTTSDDLFANLTIFTQRLAQEGEASLFAWNPQDEETIYKISVAKTLERQLLNCKVVGNEEV